MLPPDTLIAVPVLIHGVSFAFASRFSSIAHFMARLEGKQNILWKQCGEISYMLPLGLTSEHISLEGHFMH